MTCEQQEASKELKIQIELHINEQLYRNGVISEEVYVKAKSLILKCD